MSPLMNRPAKPYGAEHPPDYKHRLCKVTWAQCQRLVASGEQRYNYLYSEAELEELHGRIEAICNREERLNVYFNNCYDGKAAVNALEFIKRLDSQASSSFFVDAVWRQIPYCTTLT